MGLEEYKGVFIYAQQVDNELSSIAFELIGKAKELAKDLGTDVTAVLLGSNVKGLTDELGEYGADKVIVVDNPELETYRTEPYAQALAAVINEYKPEIMLVGATAIGRDLVSLPYLQELQLDLPLTVQSLRSVISQSTQFLVRKTSRSTTSY